MITIGSDKLSVSVDTVGACLASVRDKSTNLELLWQKDPSVWDCQDLITFPVIGKPTFCAKGKSFICDDKHGCVRNQQFQVLSVTDNFLSLRCVANENTLRQYPYNFVLTVNFCVEENELTVQYVVENADGEKMPYYIGGPPAFRAKGGKGEFVFESAERPVVHLLKDGQIYENHVFGEIKSLFVDKDLMERYQTVIFSDFQSKKYALRTAEADYEFTCDAPVLGIWSKSFGGEYICIEPWWGLSEELGMSSELAERKFINVTDSTAYHAYKVRFVTK